MTLRRSPSAALLLMSFAGLSFQLATSRLTAAVLPYEFVFVALSIALCGLGLGSLGLHQWRAGSTEVPPEAVLSGSALAFAATSIAALFLLVRWVFPYHLGEYWLVGVCLVAPFVCLGVFLAAVFARHAGDSPRLYAFDLGGAALGTLGTFAVLQRTSPIDAALGAAAAACAAAALVASSVAVRRLSAGVLVGILGLTVVNTLRPLFVVGPVHEAGNLLFQRLALPPSQRPVLLQTIWNAVARTDVIADPLEGPDVHAKYAVFMDGSNPTYMLRAPGDFRTAEGALQVTALDTKLPAAGHVAFGAGPVDHVLCLGPGAGRDVLLALRYGARHIEGAELNPAIVPLMRDYAGYNGHLYERNGVHVVTAEARSYVQRLTQQYDLIFSALVLPVGGSTSLLPGYLYTVDAYRDYWEHLTDKGRVATVVHEKWLLKRLVSSAMTMLLARGMDVAQARRHIQAFEGGDKPFGFLFMLTREPTGPEEARASAAAAWRLRPLDLGSWTTLEGFRAFQAGDAQADFHACTDDRPFCFEQFEGSVPPMLEQLALAGTLGVLLFTLVAWWNRPRAGPPLRRQLPFVLYFALLGVGFMVAEVALLQQLTFRLGYSALAVCVGLVSLLASGAVGSQVGGRLSERKGERAVLVAAALATAGVLLIAGAWLAYAGPTLPWLSLELRIAVLTLVVGAVGFVLGMPFPLGLRLAGKLSASSTPWMWGVNGVMSVVGSLTAAMLARQVGFLGLFVAAALLYLGIAALSWRLRVD